MNGVTFRQTQRYSIVFYVDRMSLNGLPDSLHPALPVSVIKPRHVQAEQVLRGRLHVVRWMGECEETS